MWKLMILGLRQQNWRNLSCYTNLTSWLWIILITIVFGSVANAQSLSWSGPANLGQIAVGANETVTLTLTNSSAMNVPVDLMIRGIKAGDPISELALFVSPTPQGSPMTTIPASGSVPVSLAFSPIQIGIIDVDITARDITGITYDLEVTAAGIPAPPTNVEVIPQ